MDEIPTSGISLIKNVMRYAFCLMLCVMYHYNVKLINASRQVRKTRVYFI